MQTFRITIIASVLLVLSAFRALSCDGFQADPTLLEHIFGSSSSSCWSTSLNRGNWPIVVSRTTAENALDLIDKRNYVLQPEFKVRFQQIHTYLSAHAGTTASIWYPVGNNLCDIQMSDGHVIRITAEDDCRLTKGAMGAILADILDRMIMASEMLQIYPTAYVRDAFVERKSASPNGRFLEVFLRVNGLSVHFANTLGLREQHVFDDEPERTLGAWLAGQPKRGGDFLYSRGLRSPTVASLRTGNSSTIPSPSSQEPVVVDRRNVLGLLRFSQRAELFHALPVDSNVVVERSVEGFHTEVRELFGRLVLVNVGVTPKLLGRIRDLVKYDDEIYAVVASSSPQNGSHVAIPLKDFDQLDHALTSFLVASEEAVIYDRVNDDLDLSTATKLSELATLNFFRF